MRIRAFAGFGLALPVLVAVGRPVPAERAILHWLGVAILHWLGVAILHWLGVLILFIAVCVCAGILSAVVISAIECACERRDW